jgi:hypothetical protein
MNLQQYTKIVDGKEIHYFVNDKGANIEVEKIEPNTFSWMVVYCTVDLYINIYNDDFTRKISFMVENFSTGIEGESWFEDEDEEDEDYEPTEEDSWAQTLDYLSLDDPYDAWEGFKDFWNTFKKYDEDCDDDTELMLASMIDDEKLKKWCSSRFSREDRAVFDFEIFKPEVDYDWEGEYKDEKERYVERPVFVSLNNLGTERRALRNILIDNYFVDECLEKTSYYRFLKNNKDADYEKLNIFVGEWLVDLWGCAGQGRLIGDYCLGGWESPEWEGDNTVHLLRFWKLTGVKHIEANKKSYTVFYSGQRCWKIDDDLANREKDFYPMFFSYVGDLPNVEEMIDGRVCIQGEGSVDITFPIELTAIESRIVEYYYKHKEDMEYLPKELYSKLISHLQKAYLDSVKDNPNAVKSVEELDALGCRYYFTDMEEYGDEDE